MFRRLHLHSAPLHQLIENGYMYFKIVCRRIFIRWLAHILHISFTFSIVLFFFPSTETKRNHIHLEIVVKLTRARYPVVELKKKKKSTERNEWKPYLADLNKMSSDTGVYLIYVFADICFLFPLYCWMLNAFLNHIIIIIDVRVYEWGFKLIESYCERTFLFFVFFFCSIYSTAHTTYQYKHNSTYTITQYVKMTFCVSTIGRQSSHARLLIAIVFIIFKHYA